MNCGHSDASFVQFVTQELLANRCSQLFVGSVLSALHLVVQSSGSGRKQSNAWIVEATIENNSP
jgi:hypothetical protein